MEIVNNSVLLLKADKTDETSEDKFEVILTQVGFDVKKLKTLEFEFKNLEELTQKLRNSCLYSGIVFTTPRSVKAVKQTIDDTILSAWSDKLNYVVGESTYDLAMKELNLTCRGRDSGNASILAGFILNDKTAITKPLLFPCGNLKSNELIDQLNNGNIDVDSVTVYDTVASHTLDQDFNRVTSNFKHIPEYFVYFSPSGVHSTFQYLQRLENQVNSVKFIALGPSTASALKKANLKVKSVALKPTPYDVLQAIIN